MREYMIQFKASTDTKWSTIGTDKFDSFREACHNVGTLQKRFDEKQGSELGMFRTVPMDKVKATP